MIMEIVSKKHGKFEVLIDEEDYEKVNQFKWYPLFSAKGKNPYFHSPMKVNKKRVTLLIHRIIMDAPKGLLVDHINGNPLDNRKCNLRLATKSMNAHNAGKRKNATASKYRGVTHTNGWWQARIQVQGKQFNLGIRKTEEEAAQLYLDYCRLHNILLPPNLLKP